MNIQSETVRKYVLAHLEDGSFSPEKRLPGFRKIAEELNVSGPVVQNALNTLVNE
ncbi:MAG: GntR family transcriptional regulator, partial [Lentisphaeria bacterium]|nr:GntR family transcriptional regulator [Lentisphaeria bacterium]